MYTTKIVLSCQAGIAFLGPFGGAHIRIELCQALLVLQALHEDARPELLELHEGVLLPEQTEGHQHKLDGHPQEQAEDDAVADAEGEGHGDHCHKGRHGLLVVVPGDAHDSAAHQGAQQAKDGPRGQGRHGRNHRSKGDGEQEAHASHQGGQASRQGWLQRLLRQPTLAPL